MHASVTVSTLRFTLRLICLGWLLTSVGLPPAVFAQPAATGRVVGRVFNPGTGEYVRNAEIRVQGTQNTVYSEEGGVYQLDNVPAGSATLEVAFSGYQTARAAVTVAAGAAVTRDFELVSTLPKPAGKDEVVLISKFVVTTEREGNAKAIMEQRRNMNISTSVAADSFGDGSEGNVGEFLKFLPGVDVEYVDGVSRGPRIGGLDQSYVGVTMDGASIASADAFVSYGATLNGSTGGQSRSVGFEQMSITAIESVEISRTSSADMDASSPAGTINMKTRRAFDRKGRRLDWQVSMSANSGAMTTRKGYGLDDVPRYVIRPNYQLDYSDVFLNQRLGIRLGVSKSSVLAQQQYVTHTYNRTPTTADPRPVVLTGITFADGPKLTDRSSVTFTSDFKATPRLVLSFTGMFNAFENSGHTYNLAWTASANGGAAATGRQNVVGNGLTEIRTNGLATNTSRGLTLGGGSAIKLTNTTTITPKFEFKLNALTVDGVFNFSRSKNDYETSSRGTIRVETANINNADFRATRSDPLSAEWTLVQTGGADWSNLASFTNPRTTEEGRFVVTEIYTGETNAKYVLPWRLPTSIKFGGKWAEERRISDNAVPYLVYSYIGPGGGPTGSFANYASPRKFNTDFGRITSLNVANVPTLVDRSALSVVFRERPEYFVNSATVENYYTATIANHRDFLQTVSAAYGMADTKIGKLQLRGGVRWERTETSSKEVDPYTAAEVQAAGFPISTTTRRATTIAGMNYQFLSRPRITRDGDYDNFFPSASLKYSFLPNLQAQFGYAHAISRPPIDALAGVWNINDFTLLITAPNPKLKPERSDNYVARLAYYFEPVGSFTVLVQQTEITDQRITVRGKAADFGFENDPEYAAYDFQSLDNNDSLYRYRSLELSYNQQLSFLPGLLRTTNLNLSYTRNYANQYFPGVTPHKVAGSLGWSIGRLSFRSGVVWQDDTPFTSVFGRFQRHNLKVDFGGSYRLSDRLSFFFQGRNVLNDPNLLYEGDPLRGQPAVLYRYGNFGVSWVAGVKGNF
jgi:TonB-dependent receptor